MEKWTLKKERDGLCLFVENGKIILGSTAKRPRTKKKKFQSRDGSWSLEAKGKEGGGGRGTFQQNMCKDTRFSNVQKWQKTLQRYWQTVMLILLGIW